jgi:hypothetical protein
MQDDGAGIARNQTATLCRVHQAVENSHNELEEIAP